MPSPERWATRRTWCRGTASTRICSSGWARFSRTREPTANQTLCAYDQSNLPKRGLGGSRTRSSSTLKGVGRDGIEVHRVGAVGLLVADLEHHRPTDGVGEVLAVNL